MDNNYGMPEVCFYNENVNCPHVGKIFCTSPCLSCNIIKNIINTLYKEAVIDQSLNKIGIYTNNKTVEQVFEEISLKWKDLKEEQKEIFSSMVAGSKGKGEFEVYMDEISKLQ